MRYELTDDSADRTPIAIAERMWSGWSDRGGLLRTQKSGMMSEVWRIASIC